MAVIEIQFQENIFLDIVAAKIVRQDFPRTLFPQLTPDRLVEKIELKRISFATDDEKIATPTSEGEILVSVHFLLHHTSFIEARKAGTLQPPATQTLDCMLWLKLTGAAPNMQWTIGRIEVNGINVIVFQAGIIPFGSSGFTARQMMLFADNGVVSIRIATKDNDDLSTTIINRLEGSEWGYFIEGQVLADKLEEAINKAGESAAEKSSDPKIKVTDPAIGHWGTNPPHAFATLDVKAIDVIIGMDVSLRVIAESFFTPEVQTKRLEIITTVKWDADGFIPNLPGITGIINDTVKDALVSPDGMEQTDSGDDFITFRGYESLFLPFSDLFRTELNNARVEDDGLHALGTVKVYDAPNLSFYFEKSHWSKRLDCKVKDYIVSFKPSVLHCFTSDSYFKIQFRSTVITDPPGFWATSLVPSNNGLGPDAIDVEFNLNVGAAPPVDSSSSAYIDTNLGIRWVDLGTVPAKPKKRQSGLKLRAISDCMAISDMWGMGIMHLDWLVDPYHLNYGLPAIREWTIVTGGIENADNIIFKASGPRGERLINTKAVNGGVSFLQILTDEDETLVVESNLQTSSTPPQIFRRWIIPRIIIPVEEGTIPVALFEDTLFIKQSGVVSPVLLAGRFMEIDSQKNERKFQAAVDCGSYAHKQDNYPSPTVNGDKNIAIVHRGQLFVGLAGPFHSERAEREELYSTATI